MAKNKSKLLKYLLAVVGTVFLVWLLAFASLFLAPSNSRDNRDPAKQEEMMTLVLEWGRLAPFPSSATNVSIKTEGNSFTRSFRASFAAPKQDIQSWIIESPGLNETIPEEISEGTVQYTIAPGGGANTAEVTIDYGLKQVEIYVSWS